MPVGISGNQIMIVVLSWIKFASLKGFLVSDTVNMRRVCEAGNEIFPVRAQRYCYRNRAQLSDKSSKLSLVRAI
jgi:hypothetical protein